MNKKIDTPVLVLIAMGVLLCVGLAVIQQQRQEISELKQAVFFYQQKSKTPSAITPGSQEDFRQPVFRRPQFDQDSQEESTREFRGHPRRSHCSCFGTHHN